MTTEGSSTSSVPLYPILLAAALVIGYWLDTTVSPAGAIRALLVAVAAAAVLIVVLRPVAGSWHRAAAISAAIVLGLYAKRLAYLYDDLSARMGTPLTIVWVALLAAVLAIIVRIVSRRRASWTWEGVTHRLNVAAVLLLVATIVGGLLDGRLVGAVMADRVGAVEVSAGSQTSETRPDVYVILLDGYPRADVLAHAFEFDNEAFLRELEGQEFDVAGSSHADYLWTHVTMSSLLQMEYIEDIDLLKPVVDGEAPLHPAIRRTVNRNPVFEFFRGAGYRIVAIGSGYEELALRSADVYVDHGQLNEFELKLLSSTFAGNLIGAVAPDFASASHRARISEGLAALGTLAGEEERPPQLVFAHVPAPHQPMVFGQNGAPVAVPLNEHFYSDSPIQQGLDRDEWVVRYRAQLEHLNGLVLEAVEGIIAASPSPPVIILMSDHGSASRVDWVRTSPDEASPEDLLERTGTLFAARTPGKDTVFPDDVTPVNVFRHVLDAYFNTDLGVADQPIGGGQIPPVDAAELDGWP